MESVVQAQQSFESILMNPVSVVLQFLASYGWHVVGAASVGLYLFVKIKSKYEAYRRAKEDAEHHKDPDKALAQLQMIQRIRDHQQALMLEASARARRVREEMAETKRADNIKRLKKYCNEAAGRRVGEDINDDTDYLPLSGGASTSTYRPPKKKCPGGGCGR